MRSHSPVATGWFWADRASPSAAAPAVPQVQPAASPRAAPPVLPPVAAAPLGDGHKHELEKRKEDLALAATPEGRVGQPGPAAVPPVAPGIQPHEVMPSPEQLAGMPMPPEVIAALKKGPPPDVLRGMNNPPQEYLKGLKTPPPWVKESPFQK